MILYVLSTLALVAFTRVLFPSLSTIYQRITDASDASFALPSEYTTVRVCPGIGKYYYDNPSTYTNGEFDAVWV